MPEPEARHVSTADGHAMTLEPVALAVGSSHNSPQVPPGQLVNPSSVPITIATGILYFYDRDQLAALARAAGRARGRGEGDARGPTWPHVTFHQEFHTVPVLR